MKNIVIRKDRTHGFTNWYLFECPYGLFDAIWQEVGFLLAIILRIPALPPQHMPLWQILLMMWNDNPFQGSRKVCRTVGIAIGREVIQVELQVCARLTDPDLLYALAVLNLSASPDLDRLPTWMAREIRKRAAHIHVVATRATTMQVLLSDCPEADAASGKPDNLAVRVSGSIGLISVNHVLAWKQEVAVARYITSKDIVVPEGFLAKNAQALDALHPVCLELLDSLRMEGHAVLALLLGSGFAALENRTPCFFYTKEGSVVVAAMYFVAGFAHILQDVRGASLRLGQHVLRIALGTEPCSSLAYAGREATDWPWEDGVADAIDGLQAWLPQDEEDVLASPAVDEGNADGFLDTIDGMGQTPFSFLTGGGSHDTACTCSDCKPVEKVPKIVIGAVPKAEASQEPQASQDAKGQAGPDTTGAAPIPPEADSDFRGIFASAYENATGGKAPHIERNAKATFTGKKSGERRRINRYHGDVPALSVEAMLELFELIYPGCYITDFVKAQHKGEKDVIYLHSRNQEIACPCCGKVNPWVRDANTRTVSDIPFRSGIELQLELTLGRAVCDNPECPGFKKNYTEACPFAQPNRSHTKRVQFLSLVISSSSSFRDTERQLGLMGIKFGDDRVKELLMSLDFRDEKDVEVVGMDDVAILKGQSYCTILYNMENGHLLKLIPERSGPQFEKQLHEWLDNHPKVTKVCRDRSNAYGSYIDRYCRKHLERSIDQCADRFHILQNLSKRLHDAYFSKIPNLIALSVDGEGNATVLDQIPNKQAIPVAPKPEGMDAWHYDNSIPTDDKGSPILFHQAAVDRMPERKKIERIDQRRKEYELICQVRHDYEALGRKFAWGTKKAFLEEHGITEYLFKKYINMTPEEVEAIPESWKPASKPKLYDNYQNISYKMLKDGRSICDTFWYIHDVVGGWNLGDTTLMNYIRDTYNLVYPDAPVPLLEELISMDYPDGELVVGRRRLFYALMTLDEKKQDKELAPHLDLICQEYPACEAIRSTFKEFHDILIVDKAIEKRTPEKCGEAVNALDAFITKYEDGQLSGFISALKGDIKCVRNAITMPDSSGRVEGSNCKYKLYKRLSYGRIQIESLEHKLQLGFMCTDGEFSFADIVPWLVEDLAP